MKKVMQAMGSMMLLVSLLAACSQEEVVNVAAEEQKAAVNTFESVPYVTSYTQEQLDNWKKTGSPFLETQLDNSSDTQIDGRLRSQDGLFKFPELASRSFGVNPQMNRFWSMIRLVIGNTIDNATKQYVVKAINDIQDSTNVRFYNAIGSDRYDPDYGFILPIVTIKTVDEGEQAGSSYIGNLGEEQFICIPKSMTENITMSQQQTELVAFIKHALCNVAGMYNEQQRFDRDEHVTIYTANIEPANRYHFDKITQNYYARGGFDPNSITLADSYAFSANGKMTITDKSGLRLPFNLYLSNQDKMFLNYFYLPYKAREDTYRELDDVVYDGNNRKLSEPERLQLQAYLNNGNPNPPVGGEAEIEPW